LKFAQIIVITLIVSVQIAYKNDFSKLSRDSAENQSARFIAYYTLGLNVSTQFTIIYKTILKTTSDDGKTQNFI